MVNNKIIFEVELYPVYPGLGKDAITNAEQHMFYLQAVPELNFMIDSRENDAVELVGAADSDPAPPLSLVIGELKEHAKLGLAVRKRGIASGPDCRKHVHEVDVAGVFGSRQDIFTKNHGFGRWQPHEPAPA